MSISLYDLPNDVIRLILYKYLPIKDIGTCLNTCKTFNVLNNYQLNIIKNASKGYVYCISNNLLESIKFLYDFNQKDISITKIKGIVGYESYISTNYDMFNPNLQVKINDHVVPFYECLFRISCRKSHLEISKWIYNMFFKKKIDVDITNLNNNAFLLCCRDGNLEVGKWLYELSVDLDNAVAIEQPEHYPLMFSCTSGNLEMSKWLWQLYIDNNIKLEAEIIDTLLSGICTIGCLEILKWTFTILPIILIDLDYCFVESCKYGHLDISKFLYKFGIDNNKPIDIHIDDDYSFIQSCKWGHFETSKWLYELGIEINSPININTYYNYAFRKSCKYGHLKISKWLYELIIINNDINIKELIMCSFKSSLNNSNIDVCKWLYQLNIDNSCKINILQYNSRNEDQTVIEWLNKEKEKYTIEITNKQNKIILLSLLVGFICGLL